MDRSPRTARRLLLGLVLAAAMLFAVAAPAIALTNPQVTLDQEAGGAPTRFTFVAVTDGDASITGMGFIFPKGFDLSKVTFDTVTLEGLTRNKVKVTGVATGETLSVKFDPSIAPNSTLRVQIYAVVPTNEGGTYPLKLTYSAESTATGAPVVTERTDDTMKF
ncbi:MAG TPA: hypothetical protein VIL15_05180, partial [Coriobacteriia bacterium]